MVDSEHIIFSRDLGYLLLLLFWRFGGFFGGWGGLLFFFVFVFVVCVWGGGSLVNFNFNFKNFYVEGCLR